MCNSSVPIVIPTKQNFFTLGENVTHLNSEVIVRTKYMSLLDINLWCMERKVSVCSGN